MLLTTTGNLLYVTILKVILKHKLHFRCSRFIKKINIFISAILNLFSCCWMISLYLRPFFAIFLRLFISLSFITASAPCINVFIIPGHGDFGSYLLGAFILTSSFAIDARWSDAKLKMKVWAEKAEISARFKAQVLQTREGFNDQNWVQQKWPQRKNLVVQIANYYGARRPSWNGVSDRPRATRTFVFVTWRPHGGTALHSVLSYTGSSRTSCKEKIFSCYSYLSFWSNHICERCFYMCMLFRRSRF